MVKISSPFSSSSFSDDLNRDFKIAEVKSTDLKDWVSMALKLWPGEEGSPDKAKEEMRAELSGILESPRDTALLVRDLAGQAVGFVNLSLCYEYVPGANRFPVAYVEGLYVAENRRRQGIGRFLIKQAEAWAIANGCTQMGSDVLIENEESCQFHTRVGFSEVERVVCFIKDME